MEAARSKPKWHAELRVAGISMVVGALISALFGIGRDDDSILAYLFTGAVVGFSIYLCNTVLAFVLEPLLARLSKRARFVADIVLYVVGGVTGWLIGFVIASLIFGSSLSLEKVVRGPLLIFIAITAIR